MAKNRAVFLDRDGVINKAIVTSGKPYAPTSIKDFVLYDGVKEAIRNLHLAGFKVVIVTNQPDVSKGTAKKEDVNAIHEMLVKENPIDLVKVCFHEDKHQCECRKPKAGMLIEAAKELDIDFSKSFLVGDRWRDIDAGKSVGCKTLLVESGYDERQAENPTWTVHSLLEASQIILNFQHTQQ